MNTQLQEIDGLFRSVEEYFIGYERRVIDMDKAQLASWTRKWRVASEIHRQTMEKLSTVVFNLTPEEVVTGYEEGGALLQQCLGGFMYAHFEGLYAEPMIEAIRNEHPAAYLFLESIRIHRRHEFVPVLLDALEGHSPKNVEEALYYVERYRVIEALPIVRRLLSNTHPAISQLAAEVVVILDKGIDIDPNTAI